MGKQAAQRQSVFRKPKPELSWEVYGFTSMKTTGGSIGKRIRKKADTQEKETEG